MSSDVRGASGYPFDPAENVAIVGLIALAVFVVVAARCLKVIEAQLSALERETETYRR